MKPQTTEKAIKILEIENVLIFEVDRRLTKTEIKKQFEQAFPVKIDNLRTLTRKNKKYAYIRLNKKYPAIDIATKLGMM